MSLLKIIKLIKLNNIFQQQNITNNLREFVFENTVYKPNIDVLSVQSIAERYVIQIFTEDKDLQKYFEYVKTLHTEISVKFIDTSFLELPKKVFERSGIVRKIDGKDGLFTITVSSYIDVLKRDITNLYSASCRATFGDERCKVNLLSHYAEFKALQVSRAGTITLDNTLNKDFSNGFVSNEKSSNPKIRFQIKSINNNAIEVSNYLPDFFTQNQAIFIYKGCNKSVENCKKYQNFINFRAEPFLAL